MPDGKEAALMDDLDSLTIGQNADPVSCLEALKIGFAMLRDALDPRAENRLAVSVEYHDKIFGVELSVDSYAVLLSYSLKDVAGVIGFWSDAREAFVRGAINIYQRCSDVDSVEALKELLAR